VQLSQGYLWKHSSTFVSIGQKQKFKTMSETKNLNQIVRSISKLIEEEEYKLLLSELKSKAKIDREGEPIQHLLNDNFGGNF
jgi:hypothetical protein